MRFGTAAAQRLHDQGCSYGDVSQHITHATVWWHMPLYVLRPCGKVTCGLSLCTALFTVHSVRFFFSKNEEKHPNCTESVIQPQTWKYSSCRPELAVSVWTAGYTCQSLLYDIGLKDLSLSSPFCYVQELEVMKYFYSLISWLSALAVKWIILKSPFWKADTERVFLFFMHILSMDPLYVK